MDSKAIEALSTLKNHCDIQIGCKTCKINEWCEAQRASEIPMDWDLSDLEKDGGE